MLVCVQQSVQVERGGAVCAGSRWFVGGGMQAGEGVVGLDDVGCCCKACVCRSGGEWSVRAAETAVARLAVRTQSEMSEKGCKHCVLTAKADEK